MTGHNRLLLLIFSLISINAFSQQFGGNPPSIKWQQVNTPTARIIFPGGLDSTALRVANVVSWLDQKTKGTIGNKTRKINVVLQNQTTISNAYVGLGPFRSEFYLTPTQNSFEIGSLPWPDQLAIHEYRHVQQYSNFDVGISKLLRILFGDDGQAVANAATIPNWFFEGDAVYNETNVSNQGRGRLPFFFNPYRSLWSSGKHYSWMKLRNGSYHDFTPDHYALGYLLVAYGREKYGDEFWKHVTQDAASFKGLFYPFQVAIKKYSGKSYAEFRNDAFKYFKTYFASTDLPQSTKGKSFINEEYPIRINEKDILIAKSGYKITPGFILRSSGGDRKLRTRDVALDNHYSYHNGKIVYASYRSDIRWRYKDYSDLRILSTTTGKEQMLTNRTKYFSPDINAAGDKVVAVNVSPDGHSMLHILSATDGKILITVPNPGNLFYTYPRFYTDDIIISAARNEKGQMSLLETNLKNEQNNFLTPFTYNVIGFPSISNDTVYFTSTAGGNDAIMAYTYKDKKLFKLSSSAMKQGIGNYYPSENNGRLAWSSFTSEGFKMHEESLTTISWAEISDKMNTVGTSTFGLKELDSTNADELARVPAQNFGITKYHKATGLFNFHSIQPDINDPEYTLHLLGENVINTFQTDLSFTYNNSEQWKRVGLKAIYGALFPYFSANINYTVDRSGLYHGKRVYFNELEPGAGISVLLDLGKNRSITRLNFGSIYTYNQTNFQGPYKDTLGTRSYSYLNNFISFANQVQKTKQQIFPSLAQTVSLAYKRAVTHYESSQFTAIGSLYLPGILKNHSIVINGAFLQKDTAGQLSFSSGFPFSRGYASVNLYRMTKWGATYHLPLVYPDAGFGNIVYFLRVRGDVFYDHTHVRDFYSNRAVFGAKFRSVGTEIYFDTKWWNEALITFGIRYSRLLDNDIFSNKVGRNRWEIILPVNIFNQ